MSASPDVGRRGEERIPGRSPDHGSGPGEAQLSSSSESPLSLLATFEYEHRGNPHQSRALVSLASTVIECRAGGLLSRRIHRASDEHATAGSCRFVKRSMYKKAEQRTHRNRTVS